MANRILHPPPSTLNETQFIAEYGGIYEHSPWIAREAWSQGLDSRADEPEELAGRMAKVVHCASIDEQLALIRAHPDLANRTAIGEQLSIDSTREQKSAELDRCTAAEFERFQKLNQSYRMKFDFPFVIAVKGLDKNEILSQFGQRLHHDHDLERCNAIEQIHRIAYLRLVARSSLRT